MPDARKLVRRLSHTRKRGITPNNTPIHHQPLPERLVPPGTDPPEHHPAIPLEGKSYKPHTLVDLAINSFTNRNALSPRQARAKCNMARALLKSMQAPYRPHSMANLGRFARWADDYFFLGTMSNSETGGKPTPWHLCRGERRLHHIYTPGTEAETRGHVLFVEITGNRRADIRVSETRRVHQEEWQLRKGEMLAGLLRSLAQAYIQLFGCLCNEEYDAPEKRCFMKIPSTQGITGQGYCWQILIAKIILEVRSWDHRLVDFANHRADGNGFHASAWRREERHWEVLRGDEEGRRILQDERMFGGEGEYRLAFGAETKVVGRERKVRLRREARVLADESVGFRQSGERQRFLPDRYGFESAYDVDAG